MRYGNNDYVIVNGKKYYATGGNTETKDNDNIEVEPSDEDYYGTSYTSIEKPKKGVPERNRSVGAGHVFYERLGKVKNKNGEWVDGTQSAAMRKAFTNGRDEIGKLLANVPQRILDKYGIDVKKWNEDTKTYENDFSSKQLDYGYNNENSQRVHYFLSQLKDDPHFNANDNDIKNGKIPLGSNVTYGIATFRYKPNMLINRSKEMTVIRNLLGKESFDMFDELKDRDGKGTGKYNVKDKDFSRYVDPDTGYKYITVGRHEPSKRNNGEYITTGSKTIVLDENDNVVPIVPIYDNKGRMKNFRIANTDDADAVNYIDTIKYGKTPEGDQRFRYYKANTDSYIHDNNVDLFANYNTADNPIDYPKYYSHALGGRTTRLYATGGSMGDIPLGEQPNDNYNMINEGGTHEENPMGGVPYGVNQDGSQNMVEEGEVTVGDNVYSDRVELSSDLCQQLGLPQGTTPAQAMQQIEQLYEQGQLQDEEYQEISDIIFQDQENQKQGGEQGAPPEGMEQPPAEGLDPSQLQGGAMPPEMMQGAPMPPEAMQGAMPPQQGAPMPPQEGITPDMVQGGSYAYGGYMRRRF